MIQWLRLHAPMQRHWVQSLVGELDPTCCNKEFDCHNEDLTGPNKQFLKSVSGGLKVAGSPRKAREVAEQDPARCHG